MDKKEVREFGHFPLVPDYPHTALLLVFAKQPPAAPCVLWTVPTASSVSLTASSSVSCLKPGLPWAPASPEAPSRECCYFCHTPWTSLSLSSSPVRLRFLLGHPPPWSCRLVYYLIPPHHQQCSSHVPSFQRLTVTPLAPILLPSDCLIIHVNNSALLFLGSLASSGPVTVTSLHFHGPQWWLHHRPCLYPEHLSTSKTWNLTFPSQPCIFPCPFLSCYSNYICYLISSSYLYFLLYLVSCPESLLQPPSCLCPQTPWLIVLSLCPLMSPTLHVREHRSGSQIRSAPLQAHDLPPLLGSQGCWKGRRLQLTKQCRTSSKASLILYLCLWVEVTLDQI